MTRQTWQLDHRRIGKNVIVHDRTDSTNDRAGELATDPANDGIVILAHEQTAGRGQHGRSWHCPRGSGVLMSVLVFPPPELCRPAILTAWAAVSVCETIRQAANLQAKIKWPNDVLIRGRKVCGILTESRPIQPGHCGNSRLAVIVGIGVNVNQPAETFTSPGLEHGTSLHLAAGHSFEAMEIARLLLSHLDEEYDRLCCGDLLALEACWRWRLGLLGKPVLAECTAGSHRGRLRDVSWDGIEIEMDDGSVVRVQPESVRHLTAIGFRRSPKVPIRRLR